MYAVEGWGVHSGMKWESSQFVVVAPYPLLVFPLRHLIQWSEQTYWIVIDSIDNSLVRLLLLSADT